MSESGVFKRHKLAQKCSFDMDDHGSSNSKEENKSIDT
jgi:hypothetical protein